MRILPADGKKGITVKVDEALHAEVRQALESQGMTMSEFVSLALKEWLHPRMQKKEEKNMGNMRTLAFQVPEELFQKIKEYLRRNHMTQKDFVIGLIEAELERDLARQEQIDIPEGQESVLSEEEAESLEAELEQGGLEEATELPEETVTEEEKAAQEASADVSEGQEGPAVKEEDFSESEDVEVEEESMCLNEEMSGLVEEEGEESEDEQEDMGLSMGM